MCGRRHPGTGWGEERCFLENYHVVTPRNRSSGWGDETYAAEPLQRSLRRKRVCSCVLWENGIPEQWSAAAVGPSPQSRHHEGGQTCGGLRRIAVLWICGEEGTESGSRKRRNMNTDTGTRLRRVAGRTGRRRGWVGVNPVTGKRWGRPGVGRRKSTQNALWTTETASPEGLLGSGR